MHTTEQPAEATDGASGDPRGRLDVAVVGAGQAGLAIGYFLARSGRRFVILEAGDSVATAWRERWDSLVLFTPRRYDALPGLAFPGDPDGYPGRDEVVAYLEQYARAFELPIRLRSGVRALRATGGGGFVLGLDDDRRVDADQVVVATGPFHAPIIPAVADGLAPEVFQAHSAAYRAPSDVPAGTVLVVGGGNTGFQIAKELSATRTVHLAVGSRQTPLPQRVLGRDLFWWLTGLGLLDKTVDSRVGRRARNRDTLIGSSPRELERRFGVGLKPRAVGACGRTVRFADASEVAVDAVIWATGYRPDHSWIDLDLPDADGRLRHQRGVTDIPGLYFLGLSWQHTRGSALLGWVQHDAEFIAARIEAAAPVQDAGGRPATAPRTRPHDPDDGRRRRDLTMDTHSHTHHSTQHFPTDTTDLEASTPTEIVDIPDGGAFDLRIAPVAKRLGDATVRMLAYNGSVPGPTLRVAQGSEVIVDVENRGDLEATVHWHGLRLDNRYDGTHETQRPMDVGERFQYRLQFPDEGLYWYHPHIRQDYGQEMGLYGTILVVPAAPDYWPPTHRELVVTLDDILLEDGQVAPLSPAETTYAAMGRFGNLMLVNGEPVLTLTAERGEVVRFYLVNTANTRVFNVAVRGGRMKLVGGDSGRCEHEQLVESVVLAPSERVIVDVLFEAAGEAALEHRTPDRTYELATIAVGDGPVDTRPTTAFATLRTNPEMVAERARVAPDRDREPDKTVAFVAEMEFEAPEGAVVFSCPMHPEVVSLEEGKCPQCGMKLMPTAAAAIYTCPMHPTVVSATDGRCPECGMKLMPTAGAPLTFTCPMHPEVISDEQGKCPHCGMKLMPSSAISAAGGHGQGHDHEAIDHEPHEQHHHGEHESHDHEAHGHGHDHAAAGGIEWEDDMVEVNRTTTPANTRWKVIDRSTGAENHGIQWRFRVGDRVKIRLVNEMDSDHPMHHPFHIHGAGRFLVLSRDGVEDPNLVWTDTVLVRTGEVVDILLDVTHAGRWMAHCHIAEHHESGMMFSFDVDPIDAAQSAR
jgi:FtsP/CotA-like multicopper oxidase with cupredoxin domain/cation diffusion facilitator CzcD-associated flavoprotein CzcO